MQNPYLNIAPELTKGLKISGRYTQTNDITWNVANLHHNITKIPKGYPENKRNTINYKNA